SGPRHCSQIETGPAARSAPQLRQRRGRAVSEDRVVIGAAVDVIETSTKKAPAMNAAGDRFLAPCLTWRQYAANHHGNSCRPQDSLGSGEVKPGIGARSRPVPTLKRGLGETLS